MVFTNLPGTTVYKTDQNLLPAAAIAAKQILVVGTAGKGRSTIYRVQTSSAAKAEFGTEGTLIMGMYEANQSGATDILLLRIGGTAAKVTGIGDTAGLAGYTVETILQDDSAGTDYSLYYTDATNRLVIKRNSDDLVVFDNDPTDPIERYEVIVSGTRAAAGGGDIGSPSAFVNLASVAVTGTVYTAGTDGTGLSRMEMYEKLHVAYEGLLAEAFDVIIPMDVYLDDYNVIDQGHYLGSVTPIAQSANTYPTGGSYLLGTDVDALGKVYIEKYEGEYYFWWIFDDGTSFTAADIYPTGIGSASATLKIDGTALSGDDFHEVNFAYQLGSFLYDYSTDVVDATGVIGALPPASGSPRDKARWLGKSPIYTLNANTGEYYIASSGANGNGLLGNKFMAGMYEWRSGAFGGGMILTDSRFLDGDEQVDTNNVPVDLGKYLSITPDTVFLRNSWRPAGYANSLAASYGGQYVNMPANTAPTNKQISKSITRLYVFNPNDLDLLDGAGYVVVRSKPQGLVIADAPTATLPNSDWRRLSTVRIVKEVIDGVRLAAEPFLGNPLSDGSKAALKEKIEKVLLQAVKDGLLKRYNPFEIVQTPDMEVAGNAALDLTLVPAFELIRLQVSVSLSKSA